MPTFQFIQNRGRCYLISDTHIYRWLCKGPSWKTKGRKYFHFFLQIFHVDQDMQQGQGHRHFTCLPPLEAIGTQYFFFYIFCLTFPRQKTLRSSISIKQHRERSQAQLACGLQCWYPYVRTRVERAQGCKLDHWMLMSLDPNSEISSLCAQGCELKSQEYVPSW